MRNTNLGKNDRALIESLKARAHGEVVRYTNGKVITLTKQEDERLVVILSRLGRNLDELLT